MEEIDYGPKGPFEMRASAMPEGTKGPEVSTKTRSELELVPEQKGGGGVWKTLRKIAAPLAVFVGLGTVVGVGANAVVNRSHEPTKPPNSPEQQTGKPVVEHAKPPYKSTHDFKYLGKWAAPGFLTIPGTEKWAEPLDYEVSNAIGKYMPFTGEVLKKKTRLENGYLVVPMGLNDSAGHPVRVDVVLGAPNDPIIVAGMEHTNLNVPSWYMGIVGQINYSLYSPYPSAEDMKDILKPGHQYPFSSYTTFKMTEYYPFTAMIERRVNQFKKDTLYTIRVLRRADVDHEKNLRLFANWFLVPPSLQK